MLSRPWYQQCIKWTEYVSTDCEHICYYIVIIMFLTTFDCAILSLPPICDDFLLKCNVIALELIFWSVMYPHFVQMWDAIPTHFTFYTTKWSPWDKEKVEKGGFNSETALGAFFIFVLSILLNHLWLHHHCSPVDGRQCAPRSPGSPSSAPPSSSPSPPSPPSYAPCSWPQTCCWFHASSWTKQLG